MIKRLIPAGSLCYVAHRIEAVDTLLRPLDFATLPFKILRGSSPILAVVSFLREVNREWGLHVHQ